MSDVLQKSKCFFTATAFPHHGWSCRVAICFKMNMHVLYTRAYSGWDSLVGIVTRWGRTVGGSKSGGCEIFHTRPHGRVWGSPSIPYSGYLDFPGVQRPVRGVDLPTTHPPPASTEGKESVGPCVSSPSGTSWPVLRWPLPFRFSCKIFRENLIVAQFVRAFVSPSFFEGGGVYVYCCTQERQMQSPRLQGTP